MELEKRVVARAGGPSLYAYSVDAPEPRALLGLLHGYADYGERYAHVMNALAERGISCLAIDMRGHGRAEGERGNCERFEEFLRDVDVLERELREKQKKSRLPMFLFGHSFGGLVAASRMVDSQGDFSGLVMSSPFFGLALEVPKPKLLLGKLASRVAPSLGLPSGLKGKDMTHDEKIARAYDEDPLVFKLAKARWFSETEAAQKRLKQGAGAITIPCRIVVGSADPVASPTIARSVFDRMGSLDKAFISEPGLLHEVLNEPVWPRLTSEIADWILERATIPSNHR